MKVVINADDFGISKNVNETIILCHQHGILTSTTLMAFGNAFNEAIILANENPNLGIGVHLVLDGDFQVPFFNSNIFNPGTKKLYSKQDIIKTINKFKLKQADLVRFYSLQVEKILDSGIQISHLDHHHHLHRFYPVLNALIKIANKYNIEFIRSQNILIHKSKSIVNRLYRSIHQQYLKIKLDTLNGYFDIYPHTIPEAVLRLQRLLESGKKITEIVAHPTNRDDFDTSFLLNEKVQNILSKHELINYNQLKK